MSAEAESPDLLVHLLRHGQTEWNVNNLCAGQTDIPLNGEGRAQAARITDYFRRRPLGAVFGSDMSRTRSTAEGICETHGLAYREDRRLREINYGRLEGTDSSRWDELFPELMRKWNYGSFAEAPPEGESRQSLIRRSVAFLDELASGNERAPVLVVTHGGVIKALLTHVVLRGAGHEVDRSLGLFRVDNASVTTLRFRNGRWRVDAVNFVPE